MVQVGVLALVCGLLLGACTPRINQSPIPRDVGSIRVLGTPTANLMKIDDRGNLTAFRGDSDHQAAVHVIDGGHLDEGETARLKAAVRYSKLPQDIAGCCSPRPIFIFYDRRGRYEGNLRACFECGCSEAADAAGHRAKRWIEWNRQIIGAIATHHHLTPLKPARF